MAAGQVLSHPALMLSEIMRAGLPFCTHACGCLSLSDAYTFLCVVLVSGPSDDWYWYGSRYESRADFKSHAEHYCVSNDLQSSCFVT